MLPSVLAKRLKDLGNGTSVFNTTWKLDRTSREFNIL